MTRIIKLFLFGLLGLHTAFAQSSQPLLEQGFDRKEYADLLWLQFHGLDESLTINKSFDLQKASYQKLMMTPEVGLANKAAIFLRSDGVVVLELRGTVNKMESWLANFYSGMVAGSGTLQLAPDFSFSYKVAAHTKAAVHIGWLLGTAFLAREYMPVLDSLIANGHNQLLVSGHSQGGALAFITSSYLHYHYHSKNQPVNLKTYASAAPKPGNLYYAYDFESITSGNRGFRIVNTADWVPETPFSLQTLRDFNEVNPFKNVKPALKQQKLLVRMYLQNVYKKLDRKSAKTARHFRKYMGEKLYKQVAKSLPGFQKPALHASQNYSTAGIPIVLTPNEAYNSRFVADEKNVFVHHLYQPYLFLLNLHFPETKN
jgi:hypothetical protein